MHRGYIKLWRKTLESTLYNEKREFSKFEAWIDILLNVNYKPKSSIIGNEIIYCSSGQKIFSLETWRNRWKWKSKEKVKRFLKMLHSSDKIIYEPLKKTTRITIINWELYQGTTPETNIPDGTIPDGTIPDGTIPDGTIPDGTIPDGTIPDGTIPDGTIPDGTIPDGTIPESNLHTKVFEYWNTKKIIVHKKIDSFTKNQIIKILKEFQFEEIILSIDNYDKILKSEETYFKHKWTLFEFLKKPNGFLVFRYKEISDYKKTIIKNKYNENEQKNNFKDFFKDTI